MIVDICSYDTLNTVGGPLMWAQRVPLLLKEKGIDVRVRLFSWCEPTDGATYKFLTSCGIPVTSCRFSETRANVGWLLKQAEHDPPDVLIANHVVPALLAAPVFRRNGIPTVGVLRSDDDFYRAIVEVFVSGGKAFRLSAVVCVSAYLAECVSAKKPEKTIVRRIPSGTPVPVQSVKPPHDRLRLVYVGRFEVEQKQALLLVRSLCRAVNEVEDVEAVLIGTGSAQAEMESIASEHGAGRVRILGGLDGEGVMAELLDSHVFVLLSDYEGTPTAVMEAMACGCVPVCLSIRSGVPELVENEVTGILVQDRGDSFVAAVRRLRKDLPFWKRLSEGARGRIVGGYSVEWSVSQWTGLLTDLVRLERVQTRFRIPRRLPLPRVHSQLARQDDRGAGTMKRLARRIMRLRFHLGKWRRIMTAGIIKMGTSR